jgi:hypothetical protein
MTRNPQRNLPPMEVKSCDVGETTKRRTTGEYLSRGAGWILPCLERAQQDSMPIKEALDFMLKDRSQWHRELLGLGHTSLLSLALMPEAFWRNFFGHVAKHFKWNLAVVEDVTRPLTHSERLDRAMVMWLNAWPEIRMYMKAGATALDNQCRSCQDLHFEKMRAK